MTTLRASKLIAAILFAAVAVSVTALDLWTKEAIFELLKVENAGTPPHVIDQARYTVIPKYFELEANYNYGAFSGWFSEHTGWLAALSGAALAVILGILVYQLRLPRAPSLLFTLALGCLWGGTCGNLYDRAVLGAVRDWIKWYYVSSDGRERVWPNFNIADSAICTGVGLLILMEVLLAGKRKRPEEKAG